MGKRGPKKKYENPKDLENAINEYFAISEGKGEFPDAAGMRLFLNISKRTLDAYSSGETEEAQAYRDVLDAAKDRRESWLARRMVTEPKAANGCMNALKQPDNGGYIDKPIQETGERKLTINLVHIKGGEEAFK